MNMVSGIKLKLYNYGWKKYCLILCEKIFSNMNVVLGIETFSFLIIFYFIF